MFDTGATIPLQGWPLRPRLTIGYATASGDDRPRDGVDRTYRQSDAVYHAYRQNTVAPVTAMNIDPNHDSRSTRSLGQALDLIVGWRPGGSWRIAFAAGWFHPTRRFAEPGGPAPMQRANDAYSLRMKVDYRF